jgi:hypothetical protein
MSTIANDAVNIPKTSTGPKTEAGKATSSRNAIRTGLESPLRGESLYAARYFIRSDEEEEYAQTLIKLMGELTPEGTIEQTFATEIMGATWRLRRCRLVEEAFSSIEDLDFDPMMDERTEKQQKSVDRARAQSHLILRRSLAELRKLQTGRQLRPAETPQPIRYTRDELKAIAKADVDAIMAERALSSFCKPGETLPPALKPVTSFCKPAPQTGRNAQCPCGSGNKYKRCCGKDAPPVLNQAA